MVFLHLYILLKQHFSAKILYRHLQFPVEGALTVGGHPYRAVLPIQGKQHGGVQGGELVLQRFLMAVEVNGGPRGHRPSVVELPVEGSHVVGHGIAVRLDGHPHAEGLGELAHIDIFLKVARCGIVPFDEIVDLASAAGVFLVSGQESVFTHQFIQAVFSFHRGLVVTQGFESRVVAGSLFQSTKVGIGLIAIFAVETAHLLAISLKGQLTPPDPPVMHVALGKAFGPPPPFRRRAGPIGTGAVVGVNHRGKDLLKEPVVARLDGKVILFRPFERLLPAPVVVAFGDFVAAAPQG